jgi:hypothetical protein
LIISKVNGPYEKYLIIVQKSSSDRQILALPSVLSFSHINVHCIRENVGHEVHIRHTGNDILKITSGEIREALLAPAHDQDEKPLEKQAYHGKNSINPDDDPYHYPVSDP